MAETIKERDFIELEYTGRIKGEDFVFDTTDEKIAKENGLAEKGARFGPVTVCIGEGMLLKGLEKSLVGKAAGRYTINLSAEDGFGKKSASQIQLVSTSKFKSQKINPVPGLQVEIDGAVGVIKTVTGGRTLVDFNHPLASKELSYDIEVKRIITDPKEKAERYLETTVRIKNAKYSLEGDELKIRMQRTFPKEIEDVLSQKVTSLIPEIKRVSFEAEAKPGGEEPVERPKPEAAKEATSGEAAPGEGGSDLKKKPGKKAKDEPR